MQRIRNEGCGSDESGAGRQKRALPHRSIWICVTYETLLFIQKGKFEICRSQMRHGGEIVGHRNIGGSVRHMSVQCLDVFNTKIQKMHISTPS
jgi:hypothetical protein